MSKTIKKITIFTDGCGDEYVRVRIDGEDFCIAAHDYVKGDRYKFTWDDAMNALNDDRLTMFTKKQLSIYNNYRDTINNKLKEIGGDVLRNDNYWTSTEETLYGPSSVLTYVGALAYTYVVNKDNKLRVRPVFDLSTK